MGIDVAAFFELSFPTVEHERAWRQATARESAYDDQGLGLLAPLGKGRKRVAQTLVVVREAAANGHFADTSEGTQVRLELVVPEDAWARCGSPLHAAARVAAEHEGTGSLRIVGFEGTRHMVVVEIAKGRSSVREPTKAERAATERAIEELRAKLVVTAEKAASAPWTKAPADRKRIRANVKRLLELDDGEGDAFRALMGAAEGASQHIVDVLGEELAVPSPRYRHWSGGLDVLWRRGERATGARHFRTFFERPQDFADRYLTNDVQEKTAHAIISMRDPEGLKFVAEALDPKVAAWKEGMSTLLEPIVRAVLLLDPVRAFERLAPLTVPTSKPKIRSRGLDVLTAFELQDWSTRTPLGRDGGVLEPRDPRWNDHLASWLASDVPEEWEKVHVAHLLVRFGDRRGLDGLVAALDHDEPLNKDVCDTLARLGDRRAAEALRAAGKRDKKLQRAYYAAAKTIEQRG